MRAKTIEIRWHWKDLSEPILSIDHHPNINLVATAGSDNAIKVWSYAIAEDSFYTFSFLSCLCKESQPVNTVRFLPRDDMLLSGHDGGTVLLWKKSERHSVVASTFETLHEDQRHNVETWTVLRTMRGHTEDVYSLAVSPDMHFAISGSIDHTIIVWELATGKALQKMEDHDHYVQGLAWDPLNVYFTSQSSDRHVNFYLDSTKKLQGPGARGLSKKRDGRFELDVSVDRDQEENGGPRYFRDETANTFFRRLHWSPDGLFVVAVCGQHKEDSSKDDIVNCAHVFLRGVWDHAYICLPVPDDESPEPVVGVRWSPIFYKLRHRPPDASPWGLDHYKMVFALFTLTNLFVYDTSCAEPVALVTNLHLATITDVTWAPDGNTLLVASKDGYVSCVVFGDGELGAAWDLVRDAEELPPELQEVKRIRHELDEDAQGETFRILKDFNPLSSRAPKPSPDPPASIASPKPPERVDPNQDLMDVDTSAPARPVVQDPGTLFDE
eukprot:GGOE01036910.1.p1 GENE.GGOE01036910.1~~GGOE01036910.1.p1  ORF type:complete len:497 (-),score=110.71 GGOE01036910.1:120-1610(-)